ncbi:transglycosylase family protein [Actinokineospora sp. 24-640]
MSGKQNSHDSYFADTDWFTPVGAPAAVATVDESDADFHAWRSQFPEYDCDTGFSDALAVTPHDVRHALGPQAEEIMATAGVDVDELIRLINAETTVLPVIPDEISSSPQPDSAPSPGLVTAIRRWKSTFLKATIAAVLTTLVGGGAAAIAMNNQVTVNVDGQTREVNTYADTVSEVLAEEGITVGQHDLISPSPAAEIGDDGHIVLERGRPLAMTVDGERTEVWVRATNLGDALRQANAPLNGSWVSAPADAPVPLEGMAVEIKTVKGITLYDGGSAPKPMKTTAVTVGELLQELGLTVGKADALTPAADTKLGAGAEVRISRTGVTVINQKVAIAPPVEEVEDPTLDQGKTVVVEPGVPGERMATLRVTSKNGKEVKREEIGSKVTKEPKAKKVKVGTKKPPVPVIPDGQVWDRLAQCEATGNWAINTGNGYYGGLQFNKSTWDAYGGSQYAAYPHQASREQQIAIATKLRDARGGYGAWPHCSSKLGLPR